ncbi:hypothetical protein K4K59_011511 [Colletotrichum sp. SAR11_240]|nr:hypothetical protein K4K59_011511 [Colletotrichum sp. SAR11_240]
MRAVPTIEEAGFCRWGFRFVGAILAIIWTIAKPVLWWLATIILPTFISFFVLAFLAGWAIEGFFGGLHTVQVRACNDILPHRFFFADWCDGINKASPSLIASSKPLPSSSAGNPLTLTESFSLQKPDRHFCVFAFGDMLGAMADEQQKYMTDKQRESFAPMRRAGAVVEQLQDIGRKQARTVERAQEKTLRLVHDPAALWSKHDPPPPPPPPPQPLSWVWSPFARMQPPPPPPSVILQGLVREILRVLQGEVTSRTQFVKDVAALSQEMAEVASSVCGWNTALEERISDKTQRLIEGEARHSNSMSPKHLLLRIYFFFVDNWPRRATKGTTGEVLKWEDQANVIRNEITKWRRRKSKASVLCKTLTVGAGKTAILLKAIQNEETHLGEMAQGAKDLLAEVLSQGVNASNNALQHLSKTARDLCIAYLQSFQQHYPKC